MVPQGIGVGYLPLRQLWKSKLVGLAFASKAKGPERVGDRDLTLPPLQRLDILNSIVRHGAATPTDSNTV